MNYKVNANKVTKLFEVINLSNKVVVKTFKTRSAALTFIKIMNNPTHGRDGFHDN